MSPAPRPGDFGVKPRRKLGQNFLIDLNQLDVIAELAEISTQDVVLEIGGGLGVLSGYLASRVKRLHVVELDRQLEEPLAVALAEHANVEVHWGDAMKLDLAELSPAPNKLVANLPYGIGASAVIEALYTLPNVELIVVMVQREVADRFAATPESGDYGASSALCQLAGKVERVRPVPRTVFDPPPNVDSALVKLRRTAVPPTPELRRFVSDTFAYRRKPLLSSVALAAKARGEEAVPSKQSLLGAFAALELDQRVRSEALTPAELAALHQAALTA